MMKTLLFILLASTVWAMDALELVNSVNGRDDGESVSRTLKMELSDKRGKTRVQETLSYRKYYGEDKKTVIFYTAPKRLRGTGFLTYDSAKKDDEQWLYLPSLRKVRRISSADRGDWFLGTDFSYEDIKKETKISLEDYDFKLLGEEDVGQHPVYRLEARTKSKEITKELGYSKIVSLIDKEIFISRKSEFYDERGDRLKTLVNSDIKKVDAIWTIHHMLMTNHQNGHITHFYFNDVDYQKELKDSLFSKAALKRGR